MTQWFSFRGFSFRGFGFRGFGFRAALLAGLLALSGAPALAQKAIDVTIPGLDKRSYKAKLYLPAQTPAPAVLVLATFYAVVHGTAEKADHAFGQALAREGFVAVVPDYIHASMKERPNQPGVVSDLAEMTAWASKRPEAGGKPVGVVGFSLGSVLGARLAAEQPLVRAFVGYYGYYDYKTFARTKDRPMPPGPVDVVRRIGAPVLLLHGSADNETPFAEAEAYKAALDKAGKRVDLIRYDGAHHRFDRGPNPRMKGDRTADGHIYRLDAKARDDAWARTVAFLRDALK